jgi:cell division protein FtsB
LDAAARGAEQVAQLEAERDRLLARVSELEDEIAALSSVTQEVEGRLDGAIGEIRAALAR